MDAGDAVMTPVPATPLFGRVIDTRHRRQDSNRTALISLSEGVDGAPSAVSTTA
ncbi:hypothetical protein [Halobellus sp. GM3]|uniref:hypothetical protein n=1 Tax=Halobellus sp. GM3 TaxID=3458410 RepID=UPI00403DB0BE